MMSVLYTWWAKYMFWEKSHGWPFGFPDPGPTPVTVGTVLVSGHRGSSEHYPENTMLAFTKAVEEGAHGIEMDVRRTLDGEYVIMHDATVDRTTNGTGRVEDLTWQYISELDAGVWRGAEFAGRPDTRVPLLSEVLDAFQGQPVFLTLHVYVPYTDYGDVVSMVQSRGMGSQVIYFASPAWVRHFLEHDPNAFTMNSGMQHEPFNLIDQGRREGWKAVSIGWDNITSDVVEAAHLNGLYVQMSALGSQYETRTQTLVDLGVNIILGDDCAAMVGVLNANNIEQITPGELW